MSAPGIFSADLDIPFTQNSMGLAIPQFGGFDASAGASLGFAILSDIEAYFFINAAHGDKRTNVLQAPKVTLFNGQQATVSDSSQKPFVMGLVPVVGDFAAALEAYEAAEKAGYQVDPCVLGKAEVHRIAGDSEAALATLDALSGAVEQTAEYLAQRAATVASLGGNPISAIVK